MDPDLRWLHQKPADLDLQCFMKRINTDSAGQGLICVNNQGPEQFCI